MQPSDVSYGSALYETMLHVVRKVFKQQPTHAHVEMTTAAATLLLDTITLSSPVFLPMGQRTMPNILSASMGVTLPFAVFLVLIFQFLHGIWSENHADDTGTKTPLLSSSNSIRRSRVPTDEMPISAQEAQFIGAQRPTRSFNNGGMSPYA